MTDSWAERSAASEPPVPRPATREAASPTAPVSAQGVDSAVRARPRTAARGPAGPGLGAAEPPKAAARVGAGPRPAGDVPPPGVAPGASASGAAARAGEGPGTAAAPRFGSLRRAQWMRAADQEGGTEAAGDGDEPPRTAVPGPDEGSGGRGTRVPLVIGGTVVLIGLAAFAVSATLSSGGDAHASAAAASTGHPTADPKASLEPLGAQPFSLASAAAPTGQSADSAASTAPASTVDVAITDSADGLKLDVDNSGTGAGTFVGTWSADGTSAQRWHLVLQSNGTYVIYTELLDKQDGLEINTNPNDYNGDTITTLERYDGSASMQWTARYLGSGKYELVSKYNGQCLQGGGQGVADATLACDSANPHQAWTIG